MTHKNRTNFERVRIKLGKWKRKLLSFFYEGIYIAYYKLFFGRNFPLARKIGTFVNSWEKRQRKGDIPLLREVWISQYQSGYWSFMKELDELARYSVIAGYFKYFKHITSILDIGCGEGILRENLDPTSYSKYVGIDISDAAIRLASQKEYLKTSFIAADAANFIPKEQFDAIVFNESLYYFDDPLLITEKYAQYFELCE